MHPSFAKCLLALGLLSAPALAADSVAPGGDPVLDPPTLRSLGAYWLVKGDDNQNATVKLAYRKAGDANWIEGMPFLRVQKGMSDPTTHPDKHGGKKNANLPDVPEDGWMFAGSALLLQPDTDYELKLTLSDPDGGKEEKTLKTRTAAEPVEPKGQTVLHVVPGNGGGSGTKEDPFKGLAAAFKSAKAGSTVLIGPGTYTGAVDARNSGEPGKPIIFRGEKGAVLDARGDAPKPPSVAINLTGHGDIWIEDLEIKNAAGGIVAHEAPRTVVRGCNIHDVEFGIVATKNSKNELNGFFITDNVMKGPSTWPRTKGIEDARGVQVAGMGHVVAYNKVSNFGDAIDTFQNSQCVAIDFHNNDVDTLTDDGFEMDYSNRNTRCFENRLTNIYQGITVQPVYGGPVYIFRNTMQNVEVEAFKLHNQPSGVYIMHNTMLKPGEAWVIMTKVPMHNIISRNNLAIGTTGDYAFRAEVGIDDCNFDYDGFGGTFKNFIKWDKQKFPSIDKANEDGSVYKHAISVNPKTAFASGVLPPEKANAQAVEPKDLQLNPQSEAVDAGEVIPGMNDGFSGKAPDLGALEVGQPVPHYGPRPGK